MKEYTVNLWWVSTVKVEAKNEEQAIEKAKYHENSGYTNLDRADIESIKEVS